MNTTQTQPRAGRHNKTTLSLEQFESLENRVKAIYKAIGLFTSELTTMAGQHNDDTTCKFIISAMKRLSEVSDIVIEPYWWHPQPEWTGGDSSDPKNTVWNEPHIVSALLK